ncbi:MAG: tRNA glutamyl-Q(34) synthetase GluQRS [Sphingomonadales bacterium 32-64-22]|nr:MAG: tRNA glutamyl-Q(34) synthetase GluQRS [Sphingomonadales bacterium 32-64-22]
MIVTRFAPSPNGPLHLGHAFAALVAHDLARERGGHFLLRIEDIDGARSRPELADAFRADLAWLGLEWEEVPRQSSRLASYEAAAERLKAMGLLYPCTCTRAQIAAAAVEPGPDGPLYPGTCRGFGDVVLLRKEAPASYHLAATLDDAADGVTLVTRGMDLFPASHVHRLLQALLGLPVPVWHHHQLLVDGEGRKLAKRRGSGAGSLGLTELRLAGEDGRALAAALRDRVLPSGISLSKGLDRGV